MSATPKHAAPVPGVGRDDEPVALDPPRALTDAARHEPAAGELTPTTGAVLTPERPRARPAGPEPQPEPETETADAPRADRGTDTPEPETAPDAPEPGTEQVSTAAALRLLRVHLRPVRGLLALGVVLLVLAALVGIGLPLAARFVLDSLAASAPLRPAVLVLLALVVASALSQGLGNFLVLRSAEDVVLAGRRRLVDRMLGLSLGGMRRQSPGDLMARVTSDTALVRQIATASLVPFVTGLVTVTGAVVVMLVLDPLLFLVTGVVVAVPTLLLTLVMPRVRRSSRETQRNVGVVGSELERVLGAYSTVKAAAAEPQESERLGSRTRRARDSGVRTALWSSVAAMTSGLAVQAAFLVVLGVGGYRVQTGTLTVATLIAFLLYAMQLSQPALQLTAAVSAFQTGRAALERIAEVDRMEREAPSGTVGQAPPTDDADPPVPAGAPGSTAALEARSWVPAAQLHGAVFTYRGAAEPALRGLDLVVPRTGVTALVGPSGSGKSTVLRLLEGFYPLDDGQVEVAGRDLTEWHLGALRRAVALVEQETPVLAGTLRGNLVYGGVEADDDRLLAVLEQVGLGPRFGAAADLDLDVGHRGAALSGGERQRVAVARALLREPTLLLLDEATSQLDAGNESLLRDVVRRVGRDTAVVLVAHRLSTVVDADHVVLLEGGRVRDAGRHAELLARDELYRAMVLEQGLADDPHPTPAPPGSTDEGTRS